MSEILLISTYELGEQPLGTAVPAGVLARLGHRVTQVDLSIQPWPETAVASCDALVISVPMHTALRLALSVIERARGTRPDLRVALVGLYAHAGAEVGALGDGDISVVGDELDALATWAGDPWSGRESAVAGDNSKRLIARPLLPYRDGLEPISSYVRLVTGDEEQLVGTVASTTGCNHRCRHCPVPTIYDGRSRALERELIALDIASLVGEGARHIHFADPDFLNRPPHALRVASALHQAHPGVTFDATIKVSHLVRFASALAELASYGLNFVVSAFESTSDNVLSLLAKGHTRDEASRAVEIARSVGVEIRPSFLPFTPWTTRDDVVDLFDFVAAHDLIDNVDAVQYGIRLLIPPGSLLLRDPDPALAEALVGFDREVLGHAWRSRDPLLDELARAIQARVEQAAERAEAAMTTYDALRSMTFGAFGRHDPGTPPMRSVGPDPSRRARLSETWFCCAEPTGAQMSKVAADEAPVPIALAMPTRRP